MNRVSKRRLSHEQRPSEEIFFIVSFSKLVPFGLLNFFVTDNSGRTGGNGEVG
jgi:hypothetical protein